MTGTPWVRFFPSDWLSGTRGMSAAETGVYITLIAMMYDEQSPLRDDETRLARLCGLRPAEFRTIRAMLVDDKKITVTGDGLWSSRVEKELGIRSEKSKAASGAAKGRWSKIQDISTADQCERTPPVLRNGCLPEARDQNNQNPPSQQQQQRGKSERRARTGADPVRGAERQKAEPVTTGADPAGDQRRTTDPNQTGTDPAGDGAGNGDRGVIEARLREAAGLPGRGGARIKGLEAILTLLDGGDFDLDLDVLPVVRAHPPTPERPVRSWAFYATICREERAAKAGGRAGNCDAATLEADLDRAREAVRRLREASDAG